MWRMGPVTHVIDDLPLMIQIQWKTCVALIAIFNCQFTATICPWHGSIAVVLYAKFCSDYLIIQFDDGWKYENSLIKLPLEREIC